MNRTDLLAEGSSRLLNDILELEKKHAASVPAHTDAITKSLGSIHKKLHFVNLREIGIFASICERHVPSDKNIWQDIIFNTVKQIEQRQYYGKILQKDSVTAQNNIVHLLNLVYRASERLRLNTENLEKAV